MQWRLLWLGCLQWFIAGGVLANPVELQVHDGDTFRIDGRSIRVHGIDAPELEQPFGQEARDLLSHLLHKTIATGHTITLNCIGNSFKRAVCDVLVGPIDVATWMVEHGAAWDDSRYSQGRFVLSQTKAQSTHQGLWARQNPMEPKLWRRFQRDLQQAATVN